MKKLLTIIVVCLLLVAFCVPVSAIEAPNSDPMKAEHTKSMKALDDSATYYGWKAELKAKTDSPSKIVTVANVRNSKYLYRVTITTVRTDKGGIKTTYKIGGTKYPLESVKAGFKKYAISKDVHKMLKAKAKEKAEALKQYGKSYFWEVSQKTAYKNGAGIATLKFKNQRYQFSATVSAKRSNGKISIKYTRQGEVSSAKEIKSWLKEYHVPFRND